MDARPKVHCKVFEDNSGAIEMATVHKVRPRTKHLNVRLHHFRSYVDSGQISIHPIRTEDQPADILTKPVNVETLRRHRRMIMGWWLQQRMRGSVGKPTYQYLSFIPFILTFIYFHHSSLSIQRILLHSNRNHQKKSIPLEYDWVSTNNQRWKVERCMQL